MLDISKINDIRDLRQMGYRNSEIVKKVKADAKTVRKYLKQDDFSPTPPLVKERPSNLDQYKRKITEWLDEDKKPGRSRAIPLSMSMTGLANVLPVCAGMIQADEHTRRDKYRAPRRCGDDPTGNIPNSPLAWCSPQVRG